MYKAQEKNHFQIHIESLQCSAIFYFFYIHRDLIQTKGLWRNWRVYKLFGVCLIESGFYGILFVNLCCRSIDDTTENQKTQTPIFSQIIFNLEICLC